MKKDKNIAKIIKICYILFMKYELYSALIIGKEICYIKFDYI